MNIEKCYMYDNNCYKAQQKCTPKGIMIHSTGANNNTIKRYVQPSKSDPNYKQLLKVIGTNKYSNSWNRDGVNKAVHYVIGKLADGSVGCVQSLPDDICAWGCGSGSKGSYNYDPAYIQFEVCEDGLTDKAYFNAIYSALVELVSYLKGKYNISLDSIISHSEGYKRGYASNHADIDHWLKKFNKTMNDLRKDVEAFTDPIKPPVTLPNGTRVKVSPECITYYNGKNMPTWVRSATLYIRQKQVKEGKDVYLVSTRKVLPVYTGRVLIADVVKY